MAAHSGSDTLRLHRVGPSPCASALALDTRHRPVCGRSAHPLAAPTRILMRSSDPGGWPNLTQRVTVELLAERE
jgi:hypothetical protein